MPRKTKLLFVILTILFLSLPLWAENYRIGVIGSDSDYKGIIKDSLGIIAQVSSDDAVSAFISRNQATVHLEYLKSREKNLKSENFSSLTKEETSYSFSGALNIEVVDVKVEEGMMTFLSSGVLEAYDYLKKDKKLDSLLFLEEEKSGTTSSFRLLMDGAVL
ncbi:MAG: hypothetical protein KBS81_01210, partial [Spirochaetales bacterium]|nr:hypothetical protein [Candidatus Physcosoma equi]